MRPVSLLIKVLIALHSGALAAYTLVWLLFEKQPWLVDGLGYILPWLFLPTVALLPLAASLRSRPVIGTAFVPVGLFVLLYGPLFTPQRNPAATGADFTVMTYNVWDSNEGYVAVSEEIKAHDPDLVCLQELTPEMVRALQGYLKADYPYMELRPEIGILSKWPLSKVAAFRLGGDGHWALQADVEMGDRRFTLFNVHPRSPRLRSKSLPIVPFGLPVGFATADRDRDVADLLRRLELAEKPLLVAGDMNLSDRTGGYQELTETLSDAHRRVGWGLGFTRTHYPTWGLPTWRIDYVFYSAELAPLRAFTGDFAGSDHRPVVAHLAFREAS